MYKVHSEILDSVSQTVDVETGEVKVSRGRGLLCARALGSCIAVIVYDAVKKIGGMAHVMLPGRAAGSFKGDKNRYSENAIDDLLGQMSALGADRPGLKVSLIGGADLTGDGDINILVRDSVLGYLASLNLEAPDQLLGGTRGRCAWLEIKSGDVFFKELYKTGVEPV